MPFAKTVLMNNVLNARLTKQVKDKDALFHGELAITHITLIALTNGRTKRKLNVHCAKTYGLLLKLPNNEEMISIVLIIF